MIIDFQKIIWDALSVGDIHGYYLLLLPSQNYFLKAYRRCTVGIFATESFKTITRDKPQSSAESGAKARREKNFVELRAFLCDTLRFEAKDISNCVTHNDIF